MKFKKCAFKGMTLTELLVTLIVGTLFLGIVLSSWYFSYKNWSIERMRASLRVDLAVVMERIKEEMRLSSLSYTSFYPSDALEYTAINFPMAKADTDDSRFLDLDDDGYIEWDKSVIYHVFENPQDSGNYELRRTEFTNNHDYLQDETDRNKQLSDLVQYGEAQASTPNKDNADTDTILESVDIFTIKSQSQLFDGYSSTIQRSDKVNFGNIKLDYGEDGYHDFKFEVVGKNADSSDYKFGIDTLSITPSGCPREAEFYYPLSSPHSDSGDGCSNVPMSGWSGNRYLEYSSNANGDFINLHLYYDLWRESNFDGSTKENTILTGDDLYIKLRDLEEGNEVSWEAGIQAGGATIEDYNDALSDITVRNVISGANLDLDGDLVRVKFDSHSLNPLTIASAYLDERDSAQNHKVPPDSNTRIKLYFTDGAGNITAGTTILAGSSAYSNWAIFPIDITKDYFVTFYISSGYGSYWAGTEPTAINSYLRDGDHDDDAAAWDPPVAHGSGLPGTDECISSPDIYAQASLEIWSKEGRVTSAAYDTKLENPNYDNIGWTESTDADISVSAGSSDDYQMAGATWDSGSDVNPHSLSIGSGRYAQFKAELYATPYWTCIDDSSVNVSDIDYKSGSKTCSACGKYLMPAVDCPWIDNVTINWPGESRMCEISGYFTKKPDYGIIKLTVDGQELTKGLEFTIAISEELQGKTYETSLTSEIEPRNTGR